MTDMIGGCVCGNLRYAADTEPIFSAVCHCKTCQKQTGTAFRIVVAVPRPAVSLQGLQKTYTSPISDLNPERPHPIAWCIFRKRCIAPPS